MLDPADTTRPPQSTSQRVICVLGMHRSGTSCLAGTLEQSGVFLGQVATYNKFNAKGNRENPAVRAVNGQVLHENGGDWDRPPQGPVVWKDAQRDARDAVVRSYAGEPLWGFKDPRTLFTLEGWLEALPGLEFVGVVRHPLAVARSLRARPRGPELAGGVRLWTAYNAKLLEYRERFGFPIVSFDAGPEQLACALRAMIKRLELPEPPSSNPEPFFDPDLKHQGASNFEDAEAATLDESVRSLHRQLSEAAL